MSTSSGVSISGGATLGGGGGGSGGGSGGSGSGGGSGGIRGIRRKKSSLTEVKIAIIGAPGVGKSGKHLLRIDYAIL